MKDDPIITGLRFGVAAASVAIGAAYVIEKLAQWATFTPEQKKSRLELMENLKKQNRER